MLVITYSMESVGPSRQLACSEHLMNAEVSGRSLGKGGHSNATEIAGVGERDVGGL